MVSFVTVPSYYKADKVFTDLHTEGQTRDGDTRCYDSFDEGQERRPHNLKYIS